MMAREREPSIRGTLGYAEPLRALNGWRVGGEAECLFRPADLEDLRLFMRSGMAIEPLTWLGLGSNVLIRDGGVRGTVVALHGALDGLTLTGARQMTAEAGVPCAKVARFAAREGLAGAEFLAGIPGTMGGALAMNAGAFGGETWDVVEAVTTIDRNGVLRERGADEFRTGYRFVDGPQGEWFVATRLALESGASQAGRERIRELLARRGATQPTGLPSCGSVFRNPPGDHAARLIESAGLKGVCIGGACVSEKHANFIVNMGEASAADIETLIRHVQAEVAARHGVDLLAEVRILGEPVS
ncbi:MAG: UDP-N-acetylmuramate dehydrogenase [Pseudomonadota bacterium]|nr:UDP-N-acetylmuramate dehydrogenase [Pseudomonadota bacterium]